jgi:hypothetical protein
MRAGVLAAVLASGIAGAGPSPEPPPGPASAPAPAPAPGSLDPFRPVAPKAAELNAAGKVPYRQGKWDEARAQYRAAIAADPDFLAPRLNVASSFVRQERFAEATAEVIALLERAYVPWAREVLEAADLGALKVRPEMKEIERAMAASAARWGEGLDESLVFVARQRPPLRVPDGPGVFVLNPRQELWAYTPRTRRYRQLTSEDGHVVAMARSADGRRVLHVTAEKLVRGAKPDDVALRSVAVRELTLATMAVSPPARVDGDVRRLDVHGGVLVSIDQRPDRLYKLSSGGALVRTPLYGRLGRPMLTLTGAGVVPATEQRFGTGHVARAVKRDGAAPGLEVGPANGKLSPIKTGEGAGLGGLPIP